MAPSGCIICSQRDESHSPGEKSGEKAVENARQLSGKVGGAVDRAGSPEIV